MQVASEVLCDDFRAWVGLRAGSLAASVRTGAEMLPKQATLTLRG